MSAAPTAPASTNDARRGSHSQHPLVRHLDLFSGIGGFALAARMVGGIETVGFCEIDPWARKVLSKNFPGVPIHDDVKTLDPKDYGRIDLVSGGYPCQPFSDAGHRKGAEDDRHLWPEVFRIIASGKPRLVLCENVAGHITMGLDNVLTDLESIGYACGSCVLPACAVGSPHRRDRVWIIAHADGIRQGGAATIEELGRKIRPAFSCVENHWRGGKPFQVPYEITPEILRMDDGLSAWMDECKGLGNAIVPQVAAEILRAMMEVDSLTNASDQRPGPL